MCVFTFSYPACNANAPYCHMLPAPLYCIFPHYLINGTIFEKKKFLKINVFWFYLQSLSETFLILRRTDWASYDEKYVCVYIYIYIYRVSKEEFARLRENVPYVKVHRYNPKHLYLKLNGYGDNGERKLWSSCRSIYCTWFAWRITRTLRMSVVQSTARSSAFTLWLHL
jgi:hypothetical protein